ncbi:MAG: carboxypeptidase-like regulatory domain-containing protein [Bacteroidetes bacterium]|nr:carboxypeptidase-like regulatory domain-containing protein [Bacteroidota bacterium]
MNNFLKFVLFFLWVVFSLTTNAQELTKIKGKVIDAKSKQPMPFVNVTFIGANIGATTDFDGNYYIETQWATSKLLASFVGYKVDTLKVQKGKTQTLNFSLQETSITMQEVTIVGEKTKYKNKSNPAVDLIKEVIERKDKNRKESMEFYEYNKYEKIEIDLNNITEDFLNQGWLKKHFQVVIDNIDTSEINGKPFLPIYLRETASKVYFRKKPKTDKEYRTGTRQTGFDGYIDEDGLSFVMDKLYQDVDIYDNSIYLLAHEFTSPISILGPTIYKYFIIDTTEVNGKSCINLAFTPRNKADYAFTGNLYILNDSSFNIAKVSMSVPKQINVNFVKDLSLEQEFTQYHDSIWMLSKDKLIIDYNITKKGRGFFGNRTVFYNNFNFNNEQPDSIYNPIEKLIKVEDNSHQNEEFWNTARPDTLTKNEKGVYTMIDSIQHIKAYKRFMDVAFLLITGWHSIGKIEIGPINTFYSFNEVEGFRLRGGFRTTPQFIENMIFDTYVAYGFDDKEYKYFGGYTYSFNKNFLTNPKHKITASYQHETNFPGQDLQFLNDDNFLLSFRRGNSKRMLFFDSYKLDYIKESSSGFSYHLIYENKLQRPLGILEFVSSDTLLKQNFNNIKTDNFSVNLRFAPNEQFYQGKNFRMPIPNKYPVFQLRFTQGINGFINGEINYSRLSANVFKRFYLGLLGYSDVELETGKIFGKVPFPLLNLPQANQSFFLQETSFNLMNFMEFMSDEYASLKITHSFNGVILNRIPLLKHLKLREIASLKLLYGPDVQKDVFLFPVNEKNESITYQFKDGIPYVEASIGISNIFKIFRIDLMQRVTYLDNQDVGSLFGVKGLAIRAKGKIDF